MPERVDRGQGGSWLSDPRNVQVNYHQEDGLWWGEVPGWRWSCCAPTLDNCRELARGGVPFCVDDRLLAHSLLFVHYHENAVVRIDPPAAETFRLYHPEDEFGPSLLGETEASDE